MRTVILITLTMFLTGCDVIVNKPKVWHDDKRFVTCYMSPTMESIYCIPDNQLPYPDECIPGTVVNGDSEFPGSCVTFKDKYTEFR